MAAAPQRLLLFIVLACISIASQACSKNMMVFIDDSDKDSLSQDSRGFRQIEAALSEQFNVLGFSVYNESAATSGQFDATKVRRSQEELIAIARTIRTPPVDIMVIFSVYASVDETSHVHKLQVRLSGKLFQVRNGRFLGEFQQSSPKHTVIPSPCNDTCYQEKLAEESGKLAQDVGAVLGEKLEYIVDDMSQEYTLLFLGIPSEYVDSYVENLNLFSGYLTHRTIMNSAKKTHIRVEDNSSCEKFQRNIHRLLEKTEMPASKKQTGNTYIFRNKKPSKKKVITKEGW